MKISIDRGKCIGAGNCVLAAPDVFAQHDDDGMVVVLDHHPPAAAIPAIEEAAETCPAKVITLD